MYCACATSFFPFLIGYILWLMCRLGTGKVPSFSVLIAFSSGVNTFVQEQLFILTIFTFTLGKTPETPLESPQYCQYPLALYLNVFYIVAGISIPNFALVSLRRSKVFALQILRRYLTKEGGVRKFFYYLMYRRTLRSKI